MVPMFRGGYVKDGIIKHDGKTYKVTEYSKLEYPEKESTK